MKYLGIIAMLVAVCACDEGSVRTEGTDGSGGGGDGAFTDGGSGGGEGGVSPGDGQVSGDGTAQHCDEIVATIRDFKQSHPDFESFSNEVPTTGIVLADLGADHKPVYANSGDGQTTGKAEFDQWYNDVPGVNQAFSVTLKLNEIPSGSGNYVYENSKFFPIDGKGFGNEGNEHNFHFTTEIHARFVYRGGEVFTFTGDDDLWLFVNNKLALDLGGLHPEASGTVDFDKQAAQLGIEKGKSYRFDIFHAERHTDKSNFKMQTSIDCFTID